MARPIKANSLAEYKNVIQSYILTTARYNFSVTEKRILYRIIEAAQTEISGVKIKDNICRVEHGLWDVEMTLPYSAILNVEPDEETGANHRDRIRAAARALASKTVEMEDTEKGEWWCDSIIHGIKTSDKNGTIRFRVENFLWTAMLDFSSGFRKYELMTAMKFRSAYTMRFYELLAGQETPLEFPVEDLKAIVGAQKKYKFTKDFIERIVKPAKKELDKSAPFTFDYTTTKEGKKVAKITLIPKHQIDKENEEVYSAELRAKISASHLLDDELYNYLRQALNFEIEEINKNKVAFLEGQTYIPDFIGFLADLRGNARTAKNPKGYIINAIKKQTAEIKQGKSSSKSK